MPRARHRTTFRRVGHGEKEFCFLSNQVSDGLFCHALRQLIDKYKPDLVWLDPILAFAGGDISRIEVISEFFRGPH
jgi:hypothetical protein